MALGYTAKTRGVVHFEYRIPIGDFKKLGMDSTQGLCVNSVIFLREELRDAAKSGHDIRTINRLLRLIKKDITYLRKKRGKKQEDYTRMPVCLIPVAEISGSETLEWVFSDPDFFLLPKAVAPGTFLDQLATQGHERLHAWSNVNVTPLYFPDRESMVAAASYIMVGMNYIDQRVLEGLLEYGAKAKWAASDSSSIFEELLARIEGAFFVAQYLIRHELISPEDATRVIYQVLLQEIKPRTDPVYRLLASQLGILGARMWDSGVTNFQILEAFGPVFRHFYRTRRIREMRRMNMPEPVIQMITADLKIPELPPLPGKLKPLRPFTGFSDRVRPAL